MTKATTRDALEAEERVEYSEALRLYKEVRLRVCWCGWLAVLCLVGHEV